MRKLTAVAGLVWLLAVAILPAQAVNFFGSHDVVTPGERVRAGLLVSDIVGLDSLTAEVGFDSDYLSFDPAALSLSSGVYSLSPDESVVLGSLTGGFSPLLATTTPSNTRALSASLAALGAPVAGSGSLLYIPMLVAANTPDGDYFVTFACTEYTAASGQQGCVDLAFPQTRARITVQRQQGVPEPSTLGLLGLGLLLFGMTRRQK